MRIKDVGRVELGAAQYAFDATFNGTAAVPIGIFLQSGANALETAELVAKKLEEISKNFPEGMDYKVAFDTTKFVDVAIDEVIKTFVEAILLVAVIVYFFLKKPTHNTHSFARRARVDYRRVCGNDGAWILD